MATELITNGSFETGTGKSPSGWTGTGIGRVDRAMAPAAEGTGYFAFGADSASHGGTIQQTIATEAGKTYTVTFKSGVSWQASNGNYDARIKVEALSGTTAIAVQNVDLPANTSAGWSTYTLTFTATAKQTTLKFSDTSPNGQANFDVGLDNVSVVGPPTASADVAGQWDLLKPWPLVGIHAVITQDGKLLTFGTDIKGVQGSKMYHDLYDPVTGQHHTINHQTDTPTNVFCSAAIIIPGTNQILISGGDTGNHLGVDDTNFFDTATHQMTPTPTGDMNYARWYATTVSLASGQVVVFGGLNAAGTIGSTTPEIFTPGAGWRTLPGANDPVVGPNYGYPRAWVSGSGEIIYFASGNAMGSSASTVTLMALDPSGDGSLRSLGQLPFVTDSISPAIMYEAGKVLIMASNGDLWTMNINGQTPVYNKVGTAGTDRNFSNMTVLADGTVMINGGTTNGNLEAGSVKTVAIWNPETGAITQGPAETDARQYHSTSIMLADGTVMSLGGGAGGAAERTYLSSQVYKPPYLFDENGQLAVRPVITAAPTSVEPGDTFTITVDNAASITKLTFSKTGATTHTFNMDARFTELDFTKGPGNTLIVKVPENVNDITAGSWMLFAWNDKGVPSVAPIIAVQPTLPAFDGIGDITAEYFKIDAAAMTLDQVNLNAPAIQTERVMTISETGTAAWYTGGPADDFGIRFTGDFNVSKAGAYTFYLTADDGARLKIDGQLVKETSGTTSPQNLTQTINLTAGKHTIELVYIETGGSGQVDLDWAGPGFARKQMTFDGAEHNLIVNGSFDKASIPAVGYLSTKNGELAGWTSSLDRIDVWKDGYDGINSPDGTTFVEVDGSAKDISQTVKTVSGQVYDLAFDFTPRGTNFASSKMELVWNGAVVATIAPTITGWKTYDFKVTGTGGNDKLTFRTITGDTDGIGGLLDGIILKPSDGSAPVDPNNMAANGSFEVGGGTMTMPMAHVMTNGNVPGWTSSANRIEIWMNGHNGVTGTDGKNVVEIDAQNGELSQAIKTEAGKAYGITFDYAGQAGAIASSAMEVLWNGVVIATINPADAAFKNYHTHAVGTGGNDVLAFRALAGDTDTKGGLLDKVVVAVSDHPVTPPAGTSELIVNGDFERSSDVAGFGTKPTGWTTTGDGGLDTDPGYAPAGKGYYALGGWSNAVGSTLQQTIATVAGQTYTLTFTSGVSYIDGALSAGAAQLQIDALNGATVLQTKTLSFAPAVSFATYSITFVATGSSSTIRFKDASQAGQGNFDIGIDNVSVKAGGKAPTGPVTNPPPGGELIVNGDFERSSDIAGFGTKPTGWTTTGDGGLDTDPGYAPAGKGYYALGGWSNAVGSTLQQTIATVAGQTYTLTFTSGVSYIDGALSSGAAQLQIDALNGATVLQTKTLSFAPAVSFADYSITFVATGSSSTIQFKDASQAGQGNFDIGIDNVSVKAGGTALAATTATPSPLSITDAPGNTISGTSGNDELFDTDADDTINAGNGNDTIVLGSRGNDTVDGGAGIDSVDFHGKASDYVFASNADGTISVSNATYGNDVLKNIETLWFAGEEKAYDVAELAPPPAAPPTDPDYDAGAHTTVVPDAHAHA